MRPPGWVTGYSTTSPLTPASPLSPHPGITQTATPIATSEARVPKLNGPPTPLQSQDADRILRDTEG